MANDQSRRNFVRMAPLAAAVGLSLTDKMFAATNASIQAQDNSTSPVIPFEYFTANALATSAKGLKAAPGNKSLIEDKHLPVTVVMTNETHKSAKEFEWHEGRDHIVQIIEGTTLYEVGGTPQNGRNTKPGEWLAPDSLNCSKFTLNKGDMLFLPRNTPHKRSTPASVTLLLISSSGTVAAS